MGMEKGSIGVGLNIFENAKILLISIGFTAALSAAPRLGLTQAAYGPLSVDVGSNPATVQFYASNQGDGTLNLTATSSDSWMAATIQQSQPCSRLGGVCYPVQISFQTSGLAKGMYTGTITLSDPNAVDSPQTVTVTVAVGGAIPDSVTLYVPNNGTPVSQQFWSASRLGTSVTQPPAGGPTLAVAAAGEGSFGETLTYEVSATASPSVAEGTYNGSFTISHSALASDNKTVAVTMNVTSKPVALATSLPPFRVGQGPVTQFVVMSNAGAGSLAISAATAASSDNGTWLTAAFGGPYVAVTVDPSKGSFTPGKTYTGTVTITTNAANSTITVPVTVQALTPGPPVAYAGRAVNIVDYGNSPLGLGDLAAVFGEQLSSTGPNVATLPLTNSLGGIAVSINNHQVPLYYTSPTQINFQIPYEIPAGQATLQVNNNGQSGNSIFVQIATATPRLFKATSLDSSIIYADANGPITPVHRGTSIVIYSLGLGQTSPPATSGVPAPLSPLMHVTPTPTVVLGTGLPDTGGRTVTPDFVGITPTTVGLYQVNFTFPSNSPLGDKVAVKLTGGPGGDSTTMYFNIVQ
jgi:uncharacterized protein (TIGR03437 family)